MLISSMYFVHVNHADLFPALSVGSDQCFWPYLVVIITKGGGYATGRSGLLCFSSSECFACFGLPDNVPLPYCN